MRKKYLFILLLAIPLAGISQSDSLKQQALQAFTAEHYSLAIQQMEKARAANPDDPEVHYYLGFFKHYQASDSRPLQGWNPSFSEQIYQHLEKAIELNPDYGNARYFYGAECSANAFRAMQSRNADQLKHYYKKAFEMGAYPPWLLEFGRNILNSCEPNSILFAGGNADFDVCSYLQLHEDFRKDVTIIPIANIDRPWYVLFLKQGLKNCVRPVNIELSTEQIYDMHPYKWDTTRVDIPVSSSCCDEFKFQAESFPITIAPDLSSNRKHSKQEGESIKNRTYLSPQKAVLLHIIENNFEQRPIFISNMANTYFYAGLEDNLSNYGLISKLLPVKTTKTDLAYNIPALEWLLQTENLIQYKTITDSDIPRISRILFNYHQSLISLAYFYHLNGEKQKYKNLKTILDQQLITGLYPEQENQIEIYFKKISELD